MRTFLTVGSIVLVIISWIQIYRNESLVAEVADGVGECTYGCWNYVDSMVEWLFWGWGFWSCDSSVSHDLLWPGSVSKGTSAQSRTYGRTDAPLWAWKLHERRVTALTWTSHGLVRSTDSRFPSLVWFRIVHIFASCAVGLQPCAFLNQTTQMPGSWYKWLIQFELITAASQQGLVSNVERNRTVQNWSHILVMIMCESTRVLLRAQIQLERSKPKKRVDKNS